MSQQIKIELDVVIDILSLLHQIVEDEIIYERHIDLSEKIIKDLSKDVKQENVPTAVFDLVQSILDNTCYDKGNASTEEVTVTYLSDKQLILSFNSNSIILNKQ